MGEGNISRMFLFISFYGSFIHLNMMGLLFYGWIIHRDASHCVVKHQNAFVTFQFEQRNIHFAVGCWRHRITHPHAPSRLQLPSSASVCRNQHKLFFSIPQFYFATPHRTHTHTLHRIQYWSFRRCFQYGKTDGDYPLRFIEICTLAQGKYTFTQMPYTSFALQLDCSAHRSRSKVDCGEATMMTLCAVCG